MEQKAKEVKAREVKIYGIVQGVGFRPHVYNLSRRHGLSGWVLNDSQGVAIHWEGRSADIVSAMEELLLFPPPLAGITGHEYIDVNPEGYESFFIKESSARDERKVLISPDVAVCSECLNELFDPNDKRYEYPFINCTNCGPRFTIIENVPYDRHLTTMKRFEMCPSCRKEYENPGCRRFHAQPNACPECGPQVSIYDGEGRLIDKTYRELFKEDAIVAVKGLGGFHLACDALNAEAVARLRRNKLRDAKPFALMASDMEVIKECCHVNSLEEKHLLSPERPILILKKKGENHWDIPADVNPNLDTLGIMLPYTPLHWMLFSDETKLLVMTSANISGNPLITKNQEAIQELGKIADYFLFHDRDIENPCDDSLGMVVNEKWLPLRRARGYVPLPVRMKEGNIKPLLACGGNLKNTFALAAGRNVFLSQHLGDLDNYLNYKVYEKTVCRMMDLVDIKPQLVVHDLHPDYQTTRYAREISNKLDLPLIGVQHHHSHMVSCMADNGLNEKVLAVICDGTGYGTDGTIWGFEFLSGDYGSFERLGHLKPVPLLGGDESVKRPSRMAFAFLASTLGNKGVEYAGKWLPSLEGMEAEVLDKQLQQGINYTMTSSCGRLFDAGAALMGITLENKYEGQGPMEMESLAGSSACKDKGYSIRLDYHGDNGFKLDTVDLWEGIIQDLAKDRDLRDMAYMFHYGVASAVRDGVLLMSETTGLNKVVLSGGVFQNRLLAGIVNTLLIEEGIKVYWHDKVPPNDGGISLGQAIVGNEVIGNVLGSTA